MKSLTVLLLVLVSGIAHANQRYTNRILCQGTAQIQGHFGTKSVPVSMDLNASLEPGANIHVVTLGNKTYGHSEEVSDCEVQADRSILCMGRGLGDGVELKVTIDTSTGNTVGTYFNPDNINAIADASPNEANTWVMNDLRCAKR